MTVYNILLGIYLLGAAVFALIAAYLKGHQRGPLEPHFGDFLFVVLWPAIFAAAVIALPFHLAHQAGEKRERRSRPPLIDT